MSYDDLLSAVSGGFGGRGGRGRKRGGRKRRPNQDVLTLGMFHTVKWILLVLY